MKLMLLLVAIYSLIYHQSRKKEEIAISLPEKNKDLKQDPKQVDENYYGDGFLFSGYLNGNSPVQLPEGSVYQQKVSKDYRYPLYRTLMVK